MSQTRNSPVELMTFDDPGDLASTAAREWLAHLRRHAIPGRVFSIALMGGRIAGPFFEAAARALANELVVRRDLHFFWGDERCVPAGSPDSNFGIARKQLLEPLKIPEAHIHPIRGEVAPAEAAAAAEQEIRAVVGDCAQGQPQLDLVFLGMGEDGHVASLFPGERIEQQNSPAVYRAVVGPKPPPDRVTIGYPALAAAKSVWVLISGAMKGAALAESLRPEGTTPLGRLLHLRRSTRILACF